MYYKVKYKRISPTVNTSRVKFDKFTVGANNTRQTKLQKWEKPFCWEKKKWPLFEFDWPTATVNSSSKNTSETTNTTKQHITFLRFRAFKKTQTGQEDENFGESWLWPGLQKQKKKKGQYKFRNQLYASLQKKKKNLRVNIIEFTIFTFTLLFYLIFWNYWHILLWNNVSELI